MFRHIPCTFYIYLYLSIYTYIFFFIHSANIDWVPAYVLGTGLKSWGDGSLSCLLSCSASVLTSVLPIWISGLEMTIGISWFTYCSSASHILIYLIHPTILGSRDCHNPHFTDEEAAVESCSTLPKPHARPLNGVGEFKARQSGSRATLYLPARSAFHLRDRSKRKGCRRPGSRHRPCTFKVHIISC